MVIIDILPLEYITCELAAQNMWANQKKGYWGKGLLNTKDDPYRTERIGRLGELAVSKYLKTGVDFAYRHKGDKHDLIIGDKKLDIKTAHKKPKYECGLIRVVSAKGTKLKLRADIYGFCYIIQDDKINKIAKICIVGFIDKNRVSKYKHRDGRAGNHKNVEIPYNKLKNYKELNS